MDNEVTGNLFKDILFITLLSFVAMIMIILPFINDPGTKTDAIAKPPGKIMVEVFWDDDINVDIDGWVKGPMDERPVGFQNKDGKQFELLRDDLGDSNDVSNRNFENFYSRGIFAGEYIVNVHWYGGTTNDKEIVPGKQITTVRVIVTVYDTKNNSRKQILKRDVEVPFNKDRNVFVFNLKANGELIEDSVHFDNRINLKKSWGVENVNRAPSHPGSGDAP